MHSISRPYSYVHLTPCWYTVGLHRVPFSLSTACLNCKFFGTGTLSSSCTAQNRKGFQSWVEHIDITVINTMPVTELSSKMALCPTTLRKDFNLS